MSPPMTAPSNLREALELTPEQIALINDMIYAWVEDKAQYREAFRDDCKRLLKTALASRPDGEKREAIARMLDPWAFTIPKDRITTGVQSHLDRAFYLADRILSFVQDEAAIKAEASRQYKDAVDSVNRSTDREIEAAIRADEREKCAKIAEGRIIRPLGVETAKEAAISDCARRVAAAIRSRSDGGGNV